MSKTHIGGDGYRQFIARIHELDEHLAADIDTFIQDKTRKPFLVVPIVFDFEDFDRCLYFSLKKKLDSIGKNTFLEFASNVQVSERDYDIMLRLARALTGLDLMYWSDNHRTEFLERFRAVYEKLITYGESEAISEHETKMMLITSNGQEKSVVFDRDELSSLSKTVKNKINTTFGNYGLSISYDEKVQILLSLIEDLLEGK